MSELRERYLGTPPCVREQLDTAHAVPSRRQSQIVIRQGQKRWEVGGRL